VVAKTATTPFVVNGERFDWEYFKMFTEYDDPSITFDPPDIETLEEWFESTAHKPT